MVINASKFIIIYCLITFENAGYELDRIRCIQNKTNSLSGLLKIPAVERSNAEKNETSLFHSNR